MIIIYTENTVKYISLSDMNLVNEIVNSGIVKQIGDIKYIVINDSI